MSKMKDLRCIFGKHKFSEWIEVENHLEKECFRCAEVETKFPDVLTVLINVASRILLKYYFKKCQEYSFTLSEGRYSVRGNYYKRGEV